MTSLNKILLRGMGRRARSLSTKLSLGLLLLAAPIFILSLGVLFIQSRNLIRSEAVGHANSVLSATMQHVSRHLTTIETATHINSWMVAHQLQPEALLSLTHQIVKLNPHIDGNSISIEPDVFPAYGRNFSAYSARSADTISTVIEEQYDYFHKVWYKTPHDTDEPCWVVYFDEADSLALTLEGMIASYCVPLHDSEHHLLGVMTSDLSLLNLSKIINSEEKPYPHSYFMMVDKEGRFYIHPDASRLFTKTIFSDADPQKQSDLIALGYEMTAGKKGSMAVDIDDESCLVCYQPVPGTTWSLALVSPDSDVLAGYHRQTYIIIPLLVIGVLVILILCYKVVQQAIKPLDELLAKTQAIAAGHIEVHIPNSQREDAIGRLQNSFATMLQSIRFHMDSVNYTTEQARRSNEELAEATRLAKEGERQKSAFIQNVTHQIRTPLNIIMGFAQVLNDASMSQLSYKEGLSKEEVRRITGAMEYNSTLLVRLVSMLFDSSDSGYSEEQNSQKVDQVFCNAIASEALNYIQLRHHHIHVNFLSDVDDSFSIRTSHLYLVRSLRELLYNAAKYSDGKQITMRITHTGSSVRFIVEDTGKGIDEKDREQMFQFFTKVDDLSEGLGLGLPLSKRHAQNLGGDLTLDVNYHKGCRFILELPIS